ncbi:MAG: hypothetical protein N2039_06155 [Gemmataceae bacterium]|nr:hypothetical protein [Gemmataceae bacterium]
MSQSPIQLSDAATQRGVHDSIGEALTCIDELGRLIRREEVSPEKIEEQLAKIESNIHDLAADQGVDRNRLQTLVDALDATVQDAQRWLDEIGRPKLRDLAQIAKAKQAYSQPSDWS